MRQKLKITVNPGLLALTCQTSVRELYLVDAEEEEEIIPNICNEWTICLHRKVFLQKKVGRAPQSSLQGIKVMDCAALFTS